MVFDDANWDFRKFKLEEDTKLADKKMAAILNATDPDLRPFQKRGGKLIMYHGWSDAAISPVNSIQYYDSVVKKMGSGTSDFMQAVHGPGTATLFHGAGAQLVWADLKRPARRSRARRAERGGALGGNRGGPAESNCHEIRQ